MKKSPMILVLAILGVGLSAPASAVQGVVQSPLKVVSMYYQSPSDAMYVQFQAGSMPGCYANSGGYLFANNSFYKELYSTLLTIIASGGVKGAVLYTQNTPTNNWSDCTITGIYLLPE